MMVFVPVLPPRRELKRSEPPDVPAGIHSVGKSGFQMKQAVYKSLHVQNVDEPNCTHPEQSSPAEEEVAETDGGDDERNLNLVPDLVSRTDYIGTPPLHRGGFPLV